MYSNRLALDIDFPACFMFHRLRVLMCKSHSRLSFYYLLGRLLKGFLILLYGFFVASLLLVIAVGVETTWALLATIGPWLFKLGLTFGCGMAILSLFEFLS